jgi:ABC-2 type transport system permease protein
MSHLLTDLFQGTVRTLGFFTKEIVGVLRQPRLIASLVLGPFLILLLFGLGFRGQHPEFRTTLVVPNEPSVSDDPRVYQQAFTGVFDLQQVTRDENRARADLQANRTDVLVVIPADALDKIYNGQSAPLQVLYSETDPTQSAWLRYFAYVQISELNRRVLAEVVRQSKGPASQALELAGQTRAETDALDADLRSGNYADAAARTGRLLVATRAAREGLAKALDALGEVGSGPATAGSGQADSLLAAMEQDMLGLQADLAQGPAGLATAERRVQNKRSSNQRLDALAQRINRIPPETLVSPFTPDTKNVLPVEPTQISFYTPAVLALLLQHMGVTLAALSSVRDRLLGAIELFRVSPVGAVNILVGKSLGYGLLLALVGVALTAAATLFLGVPSLGAPLYYWLSMGLTIFAAVGLGFAISVIASTESQAVQLSMLVLLASVFFGGFFLPLDQLFPWVRAVSYLLPVTYGAIDLREVMLRGAVPSWLYLLGPLALGLVFYGFADFGLRRQMRRA